MNKYLGKVIDLYATCKTKWEGLNKKGKLITAGLIIITVIILSKVM
tara:strand:- start:1216 stop:1353 length:138 start_codon:yes stop_codon:yes gene_type:complete